MFSLDLNWKLYFKVVYYREIMQLIIATNGNFTADNTRTMATVTAGDSMLSVCDLFRPLR